ncbi:MAG: hypothetical protein CM1200mP10_26310 [Candidatus Neomarinimicrobiota bacterium]|nr:MAG: hypothetical protein CM1200mP10_26310 [Candidatus Neomarinimicrobiota bacterium]
MVLVFPSGTWPTSQSANLDISDDGGTSTVAMRIDSDMDIIGNPARQRRLMFRELQGNILLTKYYPLLY